MRASTLRRTPRPLRSTSILAVATVLVLSACGGGSDEPGAAPEPPSYDEGVTLEVHPQVAPGDLTSDDTAGEAVAADEAAWVVDATVEGAPDSTDVELLALVDGDWEVVSQAQTDDKGRATLTTTVAGDFHVVADAVGAAGSTENAPAVSFGDDFDEQTVDQPGEVWQTRDQGYMGVRTCSKPDPAATLVEDGLLRLSVLDDPDKDTCRVGKRRHDYRLNGHVGTEETYAFTYGYAAARVKFQPARGQHGAFWMQAVGGPQPGGAEKGGAEIDVAEYFGDNHPSGGFTSFTYWLDGKGKAQRQGGWIKDIDDYGDGWAEKFHIVSVEWTPEEYVFRIDGQVTQRLQGPTSGQPTFLVASLLSSDYEIKNLDGELPQHMYVDWVRTWETGGA